MYTKIIVNHDGMVIIEAGSEANDSHWYTFHSHLSHPRPIAEHDYNTIIADIRGGKFDPISGANNADGSVSYCIEEMLVTVSPPDRKRHIVAMWHRMFDFTSRKPDYVIVTETPNMYKTFVEPRITSPNWVQRIEDGSATNEVILSETDDYYLLPDPKWDNQVKNLYLLVIFKDPGLRSIRDLTEAHIPLLEKTQDQVLKYVVEKYGHHPSQMRCYFHYMPSAWRLHMHVQYVSVSSALSSAPGSGTQCGRARLLGEVLNNLSMMPDYYQRANIECVISRSRYYLYYADC